ncbi:uncharacterized protein L201_004512 [Kwoniella dendrophila CBS 6074]|uniref:EF-hand domain-containing protein n=1 Tax=Kwoniella dendrophila CBS 6074 TaxID=1295534 RepID=A0AAX4JW15_9TREE
MAYLGRPSGGDSPFAIGDRAMKDTSSPQPPSQRNPTPRQQPQMATPQPYGSASDEARRRYEERYAKKRAEDAAKAQAESNPPPPPPPQQQQQQQHNNNNQGPPGGYGQHPQQQQYHQPPPPQRQQYTSPPPQQSRPPQGYQSPPPQHQQPQQQYQQQQRWSQSQQGQGQGQNQYNQGPPQQQYHQQQQPPPAQQQYQQSQQQYQQPQQARSPPPPPQPQGADDAELQRMFNQFDSSRTGDLSAHDLQRLLAKDTMMDAREDAVKMLMNIFDTDRSGTINFMEFEGLYRYIQDWHGIFRRFDRDSSGTIDRKELHNALLGFGFSLPKEMVIKLEKRFAPPPISGQIQNKGISFDRFLMACVTVKHYTEAFRRLDPNGQNHITVDYNSFMEIVLDAPS